MKYALTGATAILAALLTLSAQEPTTLRVDVRLVNVVATVTDKDGKFVPGLTVDDFTVLEDGTPQKITHFSQDRNVPVSVGILLDTSGSMAGKMRAASAAVERFLHNIHEDDDIFLMTFARNINLEQDFTSDRRKLAKALMSLNVGGGTLLYDGLKEAIEKVEKGRHDKRAVLILSDGIDSGSKASTRDELLRTIRGAEVLVYGLGTSQTVYADPNEHIPFTLPTPSSASRGPSAISNARGSGSRRGTTTSNTVTGVNMAVWQGPDTVQVGVRNGPIESNTMPFTFKAAETPEAEGQWRTTSVSTATPPGHDADADYSDPDELEDELDQAREEGDFTPARGKRR